MSVETGVSHQLAIVIPAYRAEFLGAALHSLRAQTESGFHVYVGDDASPEALAALCERHRAGGLPLTYHRFAENRGGGPDLVGQWDRCVRLSRGEEWVWLFSDDDVASPRCVERFREMAARASPEVNVLRFDSATIDSRGEVTALHPPHPASEAVETFAYHRLTFQRRSFAPDHIFRRSAFDRHGGFISFPFALGSDDASWITFAEPGPLVTIPEALVYWRHSGLNVSTLTEASAVEKLLALADCSRWFETHFAHRRPALPEPAPLVRIDLAALARGWFLGQLVHLPPLSLAGLWWLAGEFQRRGLGGRMLWVFRLVRRRVTLRVGQVVSWWSDK